MAAVAPFYSDVSDFNEAKIIVFIEFDSDAASRRSDLARLDKQLFIRNMFHEHRWELASVRPMSEFDDIYLALINHSLVVNG